MPDSTLKEESRRMREKKARAQEAVQQVGALLLHQVLVGKGFVETSLDSCFVALDQQHQALQLPVRGDVSSPVTQHEKDRIMEIGAFFTCRRASLTNERPRPPFHPSPPHPPPHNQLMKPIQHTTNPNDSGGVRREDGHHDAAAPGVAVAHPARPGE